MSIRSATQSLIDEFRSRPTLRAGSLITTVFGDAVAPRGGSVWIGSLIQVMAEFGVSERLVRTSVFRLTGDGWLEAKPIGRRSFYGLTADGSRRFEQATQRIYGEPRRRWAGDWCVVLLGGVSPVHREPLRKELGWLGFAQISTNVLAHPAPDTTDLDTTLGRLGEADSVIVLEAQTIRNEQAMRRLAQASWNLADIDARYASFVERFRPLIKASGKSAEMAPGTAFLVRTLLVQEYRKVLLRDPLLPATLLPAGWHGQAAYQLCRNLYRAVYRSADDYLSEVMETAEGPLPPPAASFYARFGGLD